MTIRKRKAGVKDTLYKKIYLAGSCEAESLNDRSIWRTICEEWFKKNTDGFIVINPVAYFDYSRSDHKSDTEVFRFFNRKIKECNIILVNLKNIRKSVGTICELAWAYEHNIPIIGFTSTREENDLDIQRKIYHSWIVEMCDRIETGYNALDDSLNYIKTYYGREK